MSVTSVEEIAVDLIARSEKLERQLAAAGNVVDRRLGDMERRGAAFTSRFSGALAGISAVALGREFLQLADASKSMDAQLRLATASFGTFAQAQADVQRIAAATRSGLDETTSLYGNFARASAESGRSQADAARATETFSKALKIGGADAAAAASATLQFGQALASGVLRGDEFNSIAEASPRILKLLAEALGVPTGQLRKIAEQGKLTSDILFRALTDRKFTGGIDAEFQQLPVTFDQAMSQVRNAAITTFGAFDRGSGISTALANFVGDGADGFRDLATRAEESGADMRAAFAGLHDVFAPMLQGGNTAFDALGVRIYSVREQISSLLHSFDQLANVKIGISNFQTTAESAARSFGIGFGRPQSADKASNMGDTFDRAYAASARQTAAQREDSRVADIAKRFGRLEVGSDANA